MKNLAYKFADNEHGKNKYNQENNIFSVNTIESSTISAYEQVSYEYDGSEHHTTRILEDLSNKSFLKMFNNHSYIKDKDKLLEIGCGTGSLSKFILNNHPLKSDIAFFDSSISMLSILKSTKMTTKQNVSYINRSIFTNNSAEYQYKYNMIYCGLADPYLIKPALHNIRAFSNQNSYLFITLPGNDWALKERKDRLHLPNYKTRFKLKNGITLFPYSFTYDIDELINLLFETNFMSIEHWNLYYEEKIYDFRFSNNPPFVASILAKAI